jgi:serine/threonine protein kinase
MKAEAADYVPDYRLGGLYEEATGPGDTDGSAVCPTWQELSGRAPRYDGEALLGRGATKEVFRTFDTWTMRWVALARLRPGLGPEHYDRFIHEAWINSSLSHPNIIRVLDVGAGADGRPFFTMDLKGDTTLAALAATVPPPPLHALLGILVKVCDAVAFAHSRRTLHLDLKPDNIQANAFGEVLVCDWELGRVIGGPEDLPDNSRPPDGLWLGERLDSFSLTGKINGTPGYMAPEQTIPGSLKDERTDVFALGCILHFLLTNQSPVPDGPMEEQLLRTREAGFASPRYRFPDRTIPAGLEAIFHKATAREPSGRYASAAALRDDLTGYLAGYATSAENAGFLREAALLLRRNRLAAGISLLALITITVLSVLFVQRLDLQARLTKEESARATHFAGRASEMESLYQQQSDEFRRSARDLARSIAKSGNALKNLGIFSDPVKAVDESSQMAAMALTLDPSCDAARLEQFDLHCVMLNFEAALAAPPIAGDTPYADYRELAAAAPNFAFGRNSRPEPQQLAGFLRTAAAVNSRRPALMERIVSYDIALRKDREGTPSIVSALLAYANPGWREAGFTYRPGEDSLHIRSESPLQFAVSPGGGSGKCLLRFIPIRTLKLAISGPVALTGLHQLLVEELDLRECPQAELSGIMQLPMLRTVHLTRQTLPPLALRQRLQTLQPFKIIEHAPER